MRRHRLGSPTLVGSLRGDHNQVGALDGARDVGRRELDRGEPLLLAPDLDPASFADRTDGIFADVVDHDLGSDQARVAANREPADAHPHDGDPHVAARSRKLSSAQSASTISSGASGIRVSRTADG